jgi:predicted AlkP superfamily phosphohydrolase/phosphomutase
LGLTLNPDVDWQNTKAYCPTQSSNGIHIRIARNPGEPGVSPQCYESFRKQLVADLQSLEDPISGQPLVKQILLREDAFPGPAMSNAPDMTLILFDYGFVSTARRDSIVLRNPRVRGTHNPEGILWAAGNGIRKGQVIEPLAMVDVAPNILYSLGLGIPENLEGTVTASIFEEDHLKSNPVRTGPPAREETGGAGERADAPDDTSKDDGDDAIYQHLRALGYME